MLKSRHSETLRIVLEACRSSGKPAHSPLLNMNRAVFLDRDGTLNEERHYLHKPEEVVLFSGVGGALRRLAEAGFKLIVVTNQSGVGRGYFTLADVALVNERVAELLARDGAHIDRVYIAPEAPDRPSRGRKPSPQFLLDARDELGLDLAQSYMIGDKVIDLECGWNAGVRRSLLVRTGYGAEVERKSKAEIEKAVVVDGLPAAADWILSDIQ
jgi:D-glycero-D-manno-heptose 1,7-bisphosphate phosphatase